MVLKAHIRREHKGRWEGRTPLTPQAVRTLMDRKIPVSVERSDVRIFEDSAYEAVGANMTADLTGAEIVLGIKEPPLEIVGEKQIHLCFSHTIKGQQYNMKLLQTFLDKGATLIDYEPMRDEQGIRTIAFGRYAGIAGAVDTFYVAGRKWAQRDDAGVFSQIEQTWRYGTIEKLKKSLEKLTHDARHPRRVLIVGTGNVGSGCEEVCQWLGLPKITPEQVLGEQPAGSWYSVLGTQDVVAARDGSPYNKQDYREYGSEKYESTFARYLGKFDILLQTPYWEEKYPYQLPRELMLEREADLPPVIGDISCDINGSLACTHKESSIDEPAFTYYPKENRIEDGISWDGPSVMSIDHLPCELSLDASEHFSRILVDYLVEIAHMDLSEPFETCGLGRLLQDATITYNGKLTPKYAYLQECLDNA